MTIRLELKQALRAPFPPGCPVLVRDAEGSFRYGTVVSVSISFECGAGHPTDHYEVALGLSPDVGPRPGVSAEMFGGAALRYAPGCPVRAEMPPDLARGTGGRWEGTVVGSCDVAGAVAYSVQFASGTKRGGRPRVGCEHGVSALRVRFRANDEDPDGVSMGEVETDTGAQRTAVECRIGEDVTLKTAALGRCPGSGVGIMGGQPPTDRIITAWTGLPTAEADYQSVTRPMAADYRSVTRPRVAPGGGATDDIMSHTSNPLLGSPVVKEEENCLSFAKDGEGEGDDAIHCGAERMGRGGALAEGNAERGGGGADVPELPAGDRTEASAGSSGRIAAIPVAIKIDEESDSWCPSRLWNEQTVMEVAAATHPSSPVGADVMNEKENRRTLGDDALSAQQARPDADASPRRVEKEAENPSVQGAALPMEPDTEQHRPEVAIALESRSEAMSRKSPSGGEKRNSNCTVVAGGVAPGEMGDVKEKKRCSKCFVMKEKTGFNRKQWREDEPNCKACNMSSNKKSCTSCNKTKTQADFSAEELYRKGARCLDCVEAGVPEPLLWCVLCSEKTSHFRLKQKSPDLSCRSCYNRLNEPRPCISCKAIRPRAMFSKEQWIKGDLISCRLCNNMKEAANDVTGGTTSAFSPEAALEVNGCCDSLGSKLVPMDSLELSWGSNANPSDDQTSGEQSPQPKKMKLEAVVEKRMCSGCMEFKSQAQFSQSQRMSAKELCQPCVIAQLELEQVAAKKGCGKVERAIVVREERVAASPVLEKEEGASAHGADKKLACLQY